MGEFVVYAQIKSCPDKKSPNSQTDRSACVASIGLLIRVSLPSR